LNDRSRELLRENEYLKLRVSELEGKQYGNLLSSGGKVGLNEDVLNEIRAENKELKELILKLHASGGGDAIGRQTSTEEASALSLPPLPIQDRFTGKIHDGYSFRFGTNLPVSEIYTGNPDRDLPALQF
jgi:hypothetical protein